MSNECPDGGTCHHNCYGTECWRVSNCGPLSGVYPGNRWPDDVSRPAALPRKFSHVFKAHHPGTWKWTVRLPKDFIVGLDSVIQLHDMETGNELIPREGILLLGVTWRNELRFTARGPGWWRVTILS